VRLSDLIRVRCRALAEDAARLAELAASADIGPALTPGQGCKLVLKLDRLGASVQAVTDQIGEAAACAAADGALPPRDGPQTV
jgi:hypothetical protein